MTARGVESNLRHADRRTRGRRQCTRGANRNARYLVAHNARALRGINSGAGLASDNRRPGHADRLRRADTGTFGATIAGLDEKCWRDGARGLDPIDNAGRYCRGRRGCFATSPLAKQKSAAVEFGELAQERGATKRSGSGISPLVCETERASCASPGSGSSDLFQSRGDLFGNHGGWTSSVDTYPIKHALQVSIVHTADNGIVLVQRLYYR